MATATDVQSFIVRWQGKQGAERANYQLFLSEFCDALDLPRPEPAGDETARNAYVFERAVKFQHADGTSSIGRMDLYRRGSCVVEAKQYLEQQNQEDFRLAVTPAPRKSGTVRGSAQWDDAMLKARGQAERYARALPADEDPPPFLLVVDVGHSFELYADFTQKGKAYLPFPDPTSHRFKLADLLRDDLRNRLRAVWLDPASLDPARHSAAVTREIAAHLAELAKSFEAAGHEPKLVADFLARCLFCMFAEDVGLLPKDSFSRLLNELSGDGNGFVPMMEALFKEMNAGTAYSLVLRQKLLRFNGGLFEDGTVLRVDGTQLGLLRAAAKQSWRDVEPSIFGTLLERALNPGERHKLGAHYTPRAYVERLVLPTVIEPLREDWANARATAVTHARAGRLPQAVAEVRAFHDRLCHVRVLDPACGSGNFLYVTLEHMKRLEGEVLGQLQDFGDTQALLDLATITVDPHQFLGLEVNPRAAAVADLVLWIGYLQWHFRTRGKTLPAEPVLKKFANIQCRDAVLAYDQDEPVSWLMAATDPDIPGVPDAVRKDIAKRRDDILAHPEKYRHQPVDLWDRRSTKPDPVTGREVPDESKRTILHRYSNPRPAEWPQADFIVGNPPFLGNKRMREDLGDGYAETLRTTWPDVPGSADFVMYWWNHAAVLVRAGKARRFGLITTNSIRQVFNRRIVEAHISASLPVSLSLVFAIPDHPWVDTADGAAVRISMTTGSALVESGRLLTVVNETPRPGGEYELTFSESGGRICSDLTIGADILGCTPLAANKGLCGQGIKLVGDGFYTRDGDFHQVENPATGEPVIRRIIGPNDILGGTTGRALIDFSGLSEQQARSLHPQAFNKLTQDVLPVRRSNARKSIRELWWRYAWERPELRSAIRSLPHYLVTLETSKHRIFTTVSSKHLWDGSLFAFALSDAFFLGVLSARTHVVWALSAGGQLGPTPRYNRTTCFETFPFPACAAAQAERIRALADALDAHRKRAQAEHGVGLTDMYNVLEKLRAGEALTAKEKALHDAALISTLKQLHDELDAAVAEAYGWPWPLADAEILERVVALNRARAAEEANGQIRWLRPEYQNPAGGARTQSGLNLPASETADPQSASPRPEFRPPWPKTLAEQIKAVEAIVAVEGPLPAVTVARRFTRARTATVQQILDTLAALGRL